MLKKLGSAGVVPSTICVSGASPGIESVLNRTLRVFRRFLAYLSALRGDVSFCYVQNVVMNVGSSQVFFCFLTKSVAQN